MAAPQPNLNLSRRHQRCHARLTITRLRFALGQAFVTAPADLLKTRMMADGHEFRGPLNCAVQTVRHEGALALWKGMFASYLRLGPHFLMTFPLYERIRASFGLGYL